MKFPNMIAKIRSDSGLSALEITISLSITAFVAVTLSMAVTDTVANEAIVGGRASMRNQSRDAIDFITKQLSVTGRMKDAVLQEKFPCVFTGDDIPAVVANYGYDEFAGTVSTLTDKLGDLLDDARDAGKYVGETLDENVEDPPKAYVAPRDNPLPNGVKQILFRRPGDLDGDGTVFSRTTGELEWSQELLGFMLQPGVDDTFELIFRVYDLTNNQVKDTVLCRDVLAISFDTTETRPTLPRNAIEVHLYLLGADSKGNPIKIHQSTTVLMRNS